VNSETTASGGDRTSAPEEAIPYSEVTDWYFDPARPRDLAKREIRKRPRLVTAPLPEGGQQPAWRSPVIPVEATCGSHRAVTLERCIEAIRRVDAELPQGRLLTLREYGRRSSGRPELPSHVSIVLLAKQHELTFARLREKALRA
jgi:hypothetical protein